MQSKRFQSSHALTVKTLCDLYQRRIEGEGVRICHHLVKFETSLFFLHGGLERGVRAKCGGDHPKLRNSACWARFGLFCNANLGVITSLGLGGLERGLKLLASDSAPAHFPTLPPMNITEPDFRCGRNEEELAELFNYEIHEYDQDWTYTIAEPGRIRRYIEAYDSVITDEDTKFSLMEMIIQANTDQATQELLEKHWVDVKALLLKDYDLHKYTIWYWCLWSTKETTDIWPITPYMRKLWEAQEA